MADIFLIAFIIIIALAFDFGNGMNDAANSICTIVGTRVLTLRQAAIMAGIFNFLGPFVFGVSVATTIAKGIVVEKYVNEFVILGGLAGAVLWVFLATRRGLPISASHALIGGFIGSAVMSAGFSAVLVSNTLITLLAFIFLAPVIGMVLGFLVSAASLWAFRKTRPARVNGWFKRLQLVSASMFSLGHGTNDAQKTMGIISILLFSTGMLGKDFYIPAWVMIISALAIAIGTIAGGQRVVHTLGMRTTRLTPVNGFCAETAGASLLFAAAHAGIPLSTTHTITGSIMGVGLTRRVSAVRWIVARNILYSWIVTIPFSLAAGALAYLAISFFL